MTEKLETGQLHVLSIGSNIGRSITTKQLIICYELIGFVTKKKKVILNIGRWELKGMYL